MVNRPPISPKLRLLRFLGRAGGGPAILRIRGDGVPDGVPIVERDIDCVPDRLHVSVLLEQGLGEYLADGLNPIVADWQTVRLTRAE